MVEVFHVIFVVVIVIHVIFVVVIVIHVIFVVVCCGSVVEHQSIITIRQKHNFF